MAKAAVVISEISVVILTSNLGRNVAKLRLSLGFGMPENGEDASTTFSESVLCAVRRALRPELVERLQPRSIHLSLLVLK